MVTRASLFDNRWVDGACIALVSVAMLWFSWGKWPDVIIDFGTQLYIAWRLSDGQTLFADILYFKGPLSPYLNALWFDLFGVSLRTLVFCNLAVVAGAICLLYRLFSEISNRSAATVACLVFVTLSAFGQFVSNGNWNFVCPYSHETTHGFTLALLSIVCFSNYLRSGALRWIAGAGAALGLTFLTEAPIFLAAAVAVTTGVVLAVWRAHPARSSLVSIVGVFAGSAAVPLLAAFGLLCGVLPTGQAFAAAMGSWPWIARQGVFELPFYRMWMGSDDIGSSVAVMLTWLARYAFVFAPALVGGLLLRRFGRARQRLLSVVVLAATAFMLLSHPHLIRSGDLLRPLPLIVLALCVIHGVRWLASGNDLLKSRRHLVSLVISLFAFLLLWKMILYARIYNYGFVLAAPASMLLVMVLCEWGPAAVVKRGGNGEVMRGVGMMVVLVVIAVHLSWAGAYFASKTTVVGHGPDAFFSDQKRGMVVNEALREIAARVDPDETLAVLPHGAMLNYLARRVNPMSHPNLDPLLLGISEEAQILASLKVHPPDFILLVPVNLSEHGVHSFGHDFALQIYAWVQAHYRTIHVIRPHRPQIEGDGAVLLERTDRE